MYNYEIVFMSYRGLGSVANLYPSCNFMKSQSDTAKNMFEYLKGEGGFYEEGLLCTRWIPSTAIIAIVKREN